MLCVAEALILFLKLLRLALFSVEHLGNLHTRKVLGKEGVNIGGGILNLTVCLTGEFTENNRKENDKGNEAKHHKRKNVVKTKHCHEYADNNKAVLYQVYEKVSEHHRDSASIVTYAGNELTNGNSVKLTV